MAVLGSGAVMSYTALLWQQQGKKNPSWQGTEWEEVLSAVFVLGFILSLPWQLVTWSICRTGAGGLPSLVSSVCWTFLATEYSPSSWAEDVASFLRAGTEAQTLISSFCLYVFIYEAVRDWISFLCYYLSNNFMAILCGGIGFCHLKFRTTVKAPYNFPVESSAPAREDNPVYAAYVGFIFIFGHIKIFIHSSASWIWTM